jgi:aspartyl aminopeptidase
MTASTPGPVRFAEQHRAHAEGLCAFVDSSPSPFHVVGEVARTLDAAGFRRLSEVDAWPTEPGRYVTARGGSLVAWSTESAAGPTTPFRIVGGHTDSPNLRVKQHPNLSRAGWEVVGLEPYGGPLLDSWLDRDLGLSGRVSVRVGDRIEERLVRIDDPILRVAHLAIHLAENRKGIELNPQQHLDAVWGIGSEPADVLGYVADAVGVGSDAVLGWELMAHDLAPSRLVGRDGDLLAAPRLDNQCTCYAGTRALLQAVDQARDVIPMLALFDHEEVGSMSERGAHSDLLGSTLERVVLGAGGDRQDYLRALAGSICASGDMAHATHPNYADRHEPAHRIQAGGGPVLKVHYQLRYATDATGAAAFAAACDQAKVPWQRYMHRADLPCGSTVGPVTAGRVGITTVDVGAPQLAMHSARELMAAVDVASYVGALGALFAPAPEERAP